MMWSIKSKNTIMKYSGSLVKFNLSSANSALCGLFYFCLHMVSLPGYMLEEFSLRNSTWGKEITFCHS